MVFNIRISERRTVLKKRPGLICIMIVLLVLLSGCVDPWLKADITSTIDAYSPAMSSVPGFPLKIEFDIDGPYPNFTEIKFITDTGEFLNWESDGSIVKLGKSAELAGSTLYWTPLDGSGGTVEKARLTVIVTYYDRISIVSKTFTARIVRNDEGMYILK